MAKAKTVGELRDSGYAVLSVRDEMRKNLVRKLESGETVFEGIVGFEDTVIPQVQNAILAGQDIILLGERGQAKSRMIRSMLNLLDETVPAIAGCELNDNPFDPICSSCKETLRHLGEDTPVEWVSRDKRYGEKLATPDITIADLIGEVDPIRVAEGRYLSDEMTIHYGLIPRTNRGIFCINELPDLSERIQVGLFNIMEERDVQIKGYKIRLPLDIFLVASANPEDYTNRGRIITPLKDRFGAQIRTHYPKEIEQEIQIMDKERDTFDVGGRYQVRVPQFMKEVVAEFTNLARRSPDVNQRSGVSVRVSIGNYETVVSNALRRAITLKEPVAAPRVSDLRYLNASTQGKIEIESMEEGREPRIIEDLLKRSVLNTFNRHFSVHEFDDLLRKFDEGSSVEVGEAMNSQQYVDKVGDLAGMRNAAKQLEAGGSSAEVASVVEFVLEGLHLNRRLNKDRQETTARYRA